MTLEQYKAKLEEWKKVREAATKGEWKFEPRDLFLKIKNGNYPLTTSESQVLI